MKFAQTVFITTLVSLVTLACILFLVAPAQAGPFWLLLLFVSAYASSIGVTAGIIFAISRLVGVVIANTPRSVPFKPMAFRRAYHFAVPLAAAPVMLIGLQSVSPVGLREFILVALFEIIACIYISKRIR